MEAKKPKFSKLTSAWKNFLHVLTLNSGLFLVIIWSVNDNRRIIFG